MAVSDDDAMPWPRDLDSGLDHCEWCVRLRQADGLADGPADAPADGLGELSTHVRAVRRNDSVAGWRLWAGVWRRRRRGRVMLLSTATAAAVVSGVLAAALG
ncbi:hypothetical protein [Streptomyces sp. NPDC003006]